MRITWSIPVPGEPLDSSRGNMVRARSLAHALREIGHQVEIVVASEGAGTGAAVKTYRRAIREVIPARFALVCRDVGRIVLARSHARRVALQAQKQRADLIVETQTHGVSSGARAARICGLPLVLDDCSPPGEEVSLGTAFPGLTRRRFHREAEAASALLVPSESLSRRLVREGIPERKLAVVSNGVDAPSPHLEDRGTIRRELGIEDRVVVAFAGSFQPWHKVDLLIEALAAIDRSLPVHLLLMGEGAQREAAMAATERLALGERVSFTGAVETSRLSLLLRASDIGVLPGSTDYCQPMKLLDYAAAGLPAVAPDLPPVRGVVRPDETGLLFPEGDRRCLAEALGRLAGDPALRARLGRAAQALSKERTWTRSAEVLLEAAGAPRGVDPVAAPNPSEAGA